MCSVSLRLASLRVIATAALTLSAAGATPVAGQTPLGGARPDVTRIAWDQANRAGVQSFDAVIDGAPSSLGDVSCTLNQSASTCSAVLPTLVTGTHVVSIVAIDATGVRSAPSVPVSIFVSTSTAQTAVVTPQREVSSAAAPTSDSRVCAGEMCFSMAVVARGVGTVERVVPLPDGRSLLLRGAREMLFVSERGVDSTFVLPSPEGTTAVIADVAVAPSFERDRFVFLAVVLGDTGSSQLVRVVRLHEANGLLGEATAIVPDMPLLRDAPPSIAADGAGHVYVSLPGQRGVTSTAAASGEILAFSSTGEPAGRNRDSFILARGATRPGALAVTSDRLWETADDRPVSSAIELVSLASPEQPAIGVGDDGAASDVGIRSLALTGATRGAIVTESPRALFVFELQQQNGRTAVVRTRVSLDGLEPRAVAATATGALLVSAVDINDRSSSTIVRLQPEVSH